MEHLVKTLLIVAVLLAPVSSPAADVKAFKHLLSIYADEKDAALKAPEGVACNGSDLVVADTGNGRLLRYKFQDRNLSGGTEVKAAEMPYPVRLQLNSKGEILALDRKQLRIVRLDAKGAFAGYLEPQGVPGADKIIARGLKVDGKDNIYLIDVTGQRVVALDPTGKYLKQLGFPENRRFFSDLTVTPNGDIYLLDALDPALFVSAKGAGEFVPLAKNLREYVDFPTYITSDAAGAVLYLVDAHGQAIVSLGQDGSFLARRLVMGWKEGQLHYPEQICLAGNVIFLADRDSSKVQVFEIRH